MKAKELRDKLRALSGKRKAHDKKGVEIEAETIELLQAAKRHPEVSIAEAARLAGFKRRATAFGYLERGAEDEK